MYVVNRRASFVGRILILFKHLRRIKYNGVLLIIVYGVHSLHAQTTHRNVHCLWSQLYTQTIHRSVHCLWSQLYTQTTHRKCPLFVESTVDSNYTQKVSIVCGVNCTLKLHTESVHCLWSQLYTQTTHRKCPLFVESTVHSNYTQKVSICLWSQLKLHTESVHLFVESTVHSNYIVKHNSYSN